MVRNKFVDKDDGNDVATPPPALETESGLSDLRGYAKFKLLDQSQLVGTLKLGFKTPIGEYRPVPEALSVTDGQWDFEVVGQIGRSFWPIPVYTNFDLGYRMRGEYKDTDGVEPDRSYTPGPELVFNAEAGYSPMDRLLVALKFEGLSGAEYDALSNPGEPETLSQSVTYLAPTVLVDLNPHLSLEASARLDRQRQQVFRRAHLDARAFLHGKPGREAASPGELPGQFHQIQVDICQRRGGAFRLPLLPQLVCTRFSARRCGSAG